MELTNLLFVLGYLAVPVIILALCNIACIRLSCLTVPSVFLGLYFAFAYLGILPLYFYWSLQRLNLGVQERSTILKLFMYSSCTLFLVAIGFIVARRILRWKLQKKSPLTISMSQKEVIFANFILGVCVLVLLVYLSQLSTIPLIGILLGNSESALLRSMATNDFSGKYHWYKLFMRDILSFLTFVFLANACVRPSLKNRFYAILGTILSAFSSLVSLEKAPLIFLFLGLVITYIQSKGLALRLRNLFVITLAALGLLFPMYISFMAVAHLSPSQVILGILDRLFLGSLSPAYFYLDIFPDIHPYLFGASFPNPQGIFPWERYDLSFEVMSYMSPSLSSQGIIGSAPTAFWGEAYANFGNLGIPLISLCIGILLYKVQNILDGLPEHPVKCGLISWLSLHYGKLAITGFSGFLIDFYLIGVIIVAFLLGFTLRTNRTNKLHIQTQSK